MKQSGHLSLSKVGGQFRPVVGCQFSKSLTNRPECVCDSAVVSPPYQVGRAEIRLPSARDVQRFFGQLCASPLPNGPIGWAKVSAGIAQDPVA